MWEALWFTQLQLVTSPQAWDHGTGTTWHPHSPHLPNTSFLRPLTHQAVSPADGWCQVTAAPCPVEAASQALSLCLSNGLKWPSRDWLQGESTLAGWSWSLNIQGLEQMSKQSWFDLFARHPCLKVRAASAKAEEPRAKVTQIQRTGGLLTGLPETRMRAGEKWENMIADPVLLGTDWCQSVPYLLSYSQFHGNSVRWHHPWFKEGERKSKPLQ